MRKYGIPKSTLLGILMDSERLLYVFSNVDIMPQHKRMRTVVHKGILLTWIQRIRSLNLPANGVVLHTKAEDVCVQ